MCRPFPIIRSTGTSPVGAFQAPIDTQTLSERHQANPDAHRGTIHPSRGEGTSAAEKKRKKWADALVARGMASPHWMESLVDYSESPDPGDDS